MSIDDRYSDDTRDLVRMIAARPFDHRPDQLGPGVQSNTRLRFVVHLALPSVDRPDRLADMATGDDSVIDQ